MPKFFYTMAIEIEHKYLVINDSYKEMAFEKLHIFQGYLNRSPERTVRIRIVNDKGFLTVKGKNKGEFRHEFEYEIPIEDARQILKMAEPGIVEKIRYLVKYRGLLWEVDEFHGDLNGVKVAEVELPDLNWKYQKPNFIGQDITGNPKYYNSNLSSINK